MLGNQVLGFHSFGESPDTDTTHLGNPFEASMQNKNDQ